MKRLALLLALIITAGLLSTTGNAIFPRGGTAVASCAFTGANVNGSCIDFANGATLTIGALNFTGATTLNSNAGQISGSVDRAVLCDNTKAFQSGGESIRGAGGVANVWWAIYYQDYQQQVNQCGATTTYFLLNAVGQQSLFATCTAAPANAVIEIKPNPAGQPWYGFTPSLGNNSSGCTISSAAVTFTFDSGVTYSTPYTANGAAGIELAASNIVFNFAGATICCQSYSEVNEMLDGVTGSSNFTIQGSNGNPGIIDCSANANNAPTGILTGPPASGASMVTIANVIVRRCGDFNTGQNHALYIGWGFGTVAANAAYCENVSNFAALDPGGDTTAVKFDDTCDSIGGVISNLSVYCSTITGPQGCNDNQPMDFQCGGKHTVTNSYIEMYGSGNGQSDQWSFAKFDWIGANGCPTTPAANNTLHVDKAVIVFDGHSNGAGPDGAHIYVLCGYPGAATGTCNANTGSYPNLCITNSQIVNASTDQTFPIIAGTGVYTDAGCTGMGADTNTYPTSRVALCGVAANWPDDGHGCAWPYVPQQIT